MIAYVPGRRRTIRSFIKKWSLILLAVSATASTVAAGGVIAYNARPEAPIILITPTPTATAVQYQPKGPDLSLPAAYPAPLGISLGPRTVAAVTLHLGPSKDYVVVGILPEGAALEIVGRDEDGEWLAVVFPPNSTFKAWLPVSETLDVERIEALPVEPVRLLP